MVEPKTDDTVSVAYGTAARQSVVAVQWQEGLTARAALDQSGLLDEYPEIDTRNLILGIFGRLIAEHHVLQPGDRVEIGRPLIRDPREMRWEAVAEGEVVGRRRKPSA